MIEKEVRSGLGSEQLKSGALEKRREANLEGLKAAPTPLRHTQG